MSKDNDPYHAEAQRLYRLAIQDYIASKQALLIVQEKYAGDFPGWLLDEMRQLSNGATVMLPIAADHTLTPTSLIKSMSRLLPKKINHHARLTHQAREIVTKLSRYGKSAILIIDHAHQLTYTALAILTHLAYLQEQGDHKPIGLRIVLCGQPTLLSKCHRLQVKQFQSLSLFRWDKTRVMDQVIALLETQRLRLDIDQQRTLAETVYQQSAGIPELVDKLVLPLAKKMSVAAQETQPTHVKPIERDVVPSSRARMSILAHWARYRSGVLLAVVSIGAALWLYAQHPRFIKKLSSPPYTLELTISGDRHTLQHLVRRYHLQPDAMIIKQAHASQVDYVLQYGHYVSESQAEAAIHQLPTDIRALNPRVKKAS